MVSKSRACGTRFIQRDFDVSFGRIVEVAASRRIRREVTTDEISMAVIGTAHPFILGGIASLTAECGM